MPTKKKTKAAKKKVTKAAAKKPKVTARKRSSSPRAPAPSKVAARDSAKQQLLESFMREHATTMKVLRALPAEQSELRPHPRAKSARELAWTFVMEQTLITKALTDQLSFSGSLPSPPNDLHTIIAQFERDFQGVVDLIKRTPESKLAASIKFPVGPGQMGDWTKLAFAWFILSDQIHHRGQYSVYVRMGGGKVPSIYGPSADEPWR